MKSYRLILISVVACVVVGAIRVYAGTLTLTTYYPAPTGNYQVLTSQKMGVGASGSAYTSSATMSSLAAGSMIVQGNVGIGQTSPASLLHMTLPSAMYSSTDIITMDSPGICCGNIDMRIKFQDGASYPIGYIGGGFQPGSSDGGYLSFATTVSNPGGTPTEKMRIDNNGNVGIGNTNPGALLNVGSLSNSTQAYGDYPALFVSKPTQHTVPTAEIKFSPGNPGCSGCQNIGLKVTVNDNQGTNKQNIGLWVDANSAASNYAAIFNTGNVGIGNANPQNLLDMAGGGFYDSTKGKWQNGSSIKFKQDITRGKIDPFKILERVDIVNYRYKAEVKNNPNAPYHIGFIAENTPELLSGPKRNIMDIGDSIGLLLAVAQQQQKEIENLLQDVSRLKAKIKSP